MPSSGLGCWTLKAGNIVPSGEVGEPAAKVMPNGLLRPACYGSLCVRLTFQSPACSNAVLARLPCWPARQCRVTMVLYRDLRLGTLTTVECFNARAAHACSLHLRCRILCTTICFGGDATGTWSHDTAVPSFARLLRPFALHGMVK
jgi:hypothetical protein